MATKRKENTIETDSQALATFYKYIKKGEKVKIIGIGIFKTKPIKRAFIFHPKTGKKISLKNRNKLVFIPALKLKKII